MKKSMISGMFNIDGEKRKGHIIFDEDSGIIEEASFSENNNLSERISADDIDNIYAYDDNFTIDAGDINGHSHPEQSLYTDIVDRSWDLPTWCRNTIYKNSIRLTPQHIYLGCCRAFSRMLTFGVTSVMVSFYCHNRKGNLYDKEVIRAAADTGIRLYFGRMNYDIINHDAYEAKVISQKSYYESILEAEENFLMLFREGNGKNILTAPSVHSIHASTKEAIVNSINLGNKYKRFIQFHLSEDKGDVDLSLKMYNKRPIEFLVGLYKDREVETLENLFLSDCVWIDDREMKLIKEYDMKVVLNPRMNDRIKTGEANLRDMLRTGIQPFLGTDGEASNDDLSITGEREFLSHKFTDIPRELISSMGRQPLRFGDYATGKVQRGFLCDLKITRDGDIRDVFVGGKKVVKCGKLANMDVDNIEKELDKTVKEDLI